MLSYLIKYLCIILILVSCSRHYSYFPISIKGEKGISIECEYDIKEMIVRNILKRGPYPGDIYLSFGEENSKNIDPPRSFLKRLEDLELQIKPISEKSAESDREIFILTVEVPYWNSDTEAKVIVRTFHHATLEQWYENRGIEYGWVRMSGVARWSEGVWRLAILDRHSVRS